MIKKIFFITLFLALAHLQSGVIRKPKTFRLLAAGDVMFDWGLRDVMKKKGFYEPIERLVPLFEEVDFRMVNLETPVSSTNITIDKSKSYVFNAKPEELKVLKHLNIDLVFLANNHSMDYGKKGLEETLENLKKYEISFTGAGQNLQEALKPFSFKSEFVNFTIYSRSAIGESRLFANDKRAGAAFFYPKELTELAATRRNKEILIASLHWGVEYSPEPTPVQISQAHALIDAGFKLVIGHHHHTPK
ncbi:MAG: CapA family protein [Leptospiraceae bacterium]|nr:CapA family protein [Leptospiraceae bacterium]